jgi:hypothetical protein
VDGEEELLGAPLVERAEDAVVADEGLELAAKRVALDPVCRSPHYSVSITPLLIHPGQPQFRLKREKKKRGEFSLIINPP